MADAIIPRCCNPGGRPPDSIDEPDRQLIVSVNPKTPVYDMSGKKLLVIFNHSTFQDSRHFRQRPAERTSSNKDVNRLLNSFGARRFEVTTHDDMTHDQILNQLTKINTMDHSKTSCVAIAILTHGEANGMVCAADRMYPLNDVINIMLNQPSLAGKPKLFLIQACRGHNLDGGHLVRTDGDNIARIPTHSDCLVLRSTYEGYVAFRRQEGSWLMQTLCDILDENSHVNIFNAIVLVNNRISEKQSSNDDDESLNNKKQIPETSFTLTKSLYI